MAIRSSLPLAGLAALICLASTGCGRKTGALQAWPLSRDPVVFADAFTGAVEFQAFGNSRLDALGTDSFEQFNGTGCLKIAVPNPGGGYAGGAFVASEERDLSGYDALTFYAKASRSVTLDVVGLGNDNTGRSRFEASSRVVAVTTTWTQVRIPIPDPAKLTAERGLFFFSAAPQLGSGYTLWIDEVRFERLGTITNPRPVMTARTLDWFVGSTLALSGTRTTFAVNGLDRAVDHSVNYFNYSSTNPAVASVANGVIRVDAVGTATISATLGSTPVTGAVNLTATNFAAGMAPTPALPAGDVISLFSDAYSNARVDKWSADWDQADVADLAIFGNSLKLYTFNGPFYFAGIEFTSRVIDASAMTHLHMNVMVPAGNTFKIKLVDFGANGVFGGGDDREHELAFGAASTPPVTNGAWIGFDIPLTSFTGLTNRAHLAQMVITGGFTTRTVYVDNIYFHR